MSDHAAVRSRAHPDQCWVCKKPVVIDDTDEFRPVIHAAESDRRERCPVCGGLDPGDVTHARCASTGYEGL